jgi:hypothetical protein
MGFGMGWRSTLFIVLFNLLLFRFRGIFSPLKCKAAASMQITVKQNNKRKQ